MAVGWRRKTISVALASTSRGACGPVLLHPRCITFARFHHVQPRLTAILQQMMEASFTSPPSSRPSGQKEQPQAPKRRKIAAGQRSKHGGGSRSSHKVFEVPEGDSTIMAEQLSGMGFPESQCRLALEAANNQADAAVEMLLTQSTALEPIVPPGEERTQSPYVGVSWHRRDRRWCVLQQRAS